MDVEDPHRQCEAMPFSRLKVVEVMSRSDLHGAGPEFPIDQDANRRQSECPDRERKLDPFADEVAIARIFRMDGDAVSPSMVSGRVVATSGDSASDRPARDSGSCTASLRVFMFHFDVGERGQAARDTN